MAAGARAELARLKRHSVVAGNLPGGMPLPSLLFLRSAPFSAASPCTAAPALPLLRTFVSPPHPPAARILPSCCCYARFRMRRVRRQTLRVSPVGSDGGLGYACPSVAGYCSFQAYGSFPVYVVSVAYQAPQHLMHDVR